MQRQAFVPVLPSSPFALPSQGSFCARRPLLSPSPVRAPSRAAVRASIVPFIPNIISLPAYLFGAYRFFRGFEATTYESQYKLPLAALWPLFILANGRYRENFLKAIERGNK